MTITAEPMSSASRTNRHGPNPSHPSRPSSRDTSWRAVATDPSQREADRNETGGLCAKCDNVFFGRSFSFFSSLFLDGAEPFLFFLYCPDPLVVTTFVTPAYERGLVPVGAVAGSPRAVTPPEPDRSHTSRPVISARPRDVVLPRGGVFLAFAGGTGYQRSGRGVAADRKPRTRRERPIRQTARDGRGIDGRRAVEVSTISRESLPTLWDGTQSTRGRCLTHIRTTRWYEAVQRYRASAPQAQIRSHASNTQTSNRGYREMNSSGSQSAPANAKARVGLMKVRINSNHIVRGADGINRQFNTKDLQLWSRAKKVLICVACKRTFATEQELLAYHQADPGRLEREAHPYGFWSEDPIGESEKPGLVVGLLSDEE